MASTSATDPTTPGPFPNEHSFSCYFFPAGGRVHTFDAVGDASGFQVGQESILLRAQSVTIALKLSSGNCATRLFGFSFVNCGWIIPQLNDERRSAGIRAGRNSRQTV